MIARRLIIGLSALVLVSARALDVSGTYENFGRIISAEPGPVAGTVSLQGLLGLEFDYALARALHTQINRVMVTQTDRHFSITCQDLDGAQTWSGQWTDGVGYAREEGQVNLIFRSKRYANDGFSFQLHLVGERKMLLVEVRRIVSTWLGPVEKPVGSYLFDRVTDP